MLLHYLVKVENPKLLPNFHVKPDNECVELKFTVTSYVTCHKNIALMILLKYVYNT